MHVLARPRLSADSDNKSRPAFTRTLFRSRKISFYRTHSGDMLTLHFVAILFPSRLPRGRPVSQDHTRSPTTQEDFALVLQHLPMM